MSPWSLRVSVAGAGACWYGAAPTGIRLHGKENGNYRDCVVWGLYRQYRSHVGLYRGYIGIVRKKLYTEAFWPPQAGNITSLSLR